MHPSRPVVALSAALLTTAPVIAGTGTASATVTRDAPTTTLVDVQLSRTAVRVSGLGTVRLTVSVHLTDPQGVVESINPEIPHPLPAVTLTRVSRARTGGAPTHASLDLDLTSGTPQDGVWTATTLVPSTYDGTWQVTDVQTGVGDQDLDVDPRDIGIVRTLTVKGTHRPALTTYTDPAAVRAGRGPVAVKGRVVDADTGRPIRGVRLTLGSHDADGCGAFGYGGDAWTSTDTRGRFTFHARGENGGFCVISAFGRPHQLLDPYKDTTLLFARAIPDILPVVTAAADRSRVHVGETVPVRGHAAPADYMYTTRVVLQRLVGRHWRQVGTARIRSSGRYTLQATPRRHGVNRYRVVTVAVPRVRQGVSPTVSITAR